MSKAAIVLMLSLLAGCGGHELASCKGPVFTLNPGLWQPSATDLAAPPKIATR